ncbi:MAG: FHA domain-containing protein [Granulosicoccus sp.]
MTTIIVTHENNETDEFVFDSEKPIITLGRRSTNDVCIPDLSVSGNHATLSFLDGETILEDLKSTNGSYVNGQVIQRTAISPGDDVILGKILVSISTNTVTSGTGSSVSSNIIESVVAKPATQNNNRQPTQDSLELAVAKPSKPKKSVNGASSPDKLPADQPVADLDQRSAHQDPSMVNADVGGDIARAVRPTSNAESADAQSSEASNQVHPLEGIEHLVVPGAKPSATPMHELDSPSSPSKGAVIEIKNGAKSGQILPIDKPVTTLGRPGIQIAAIMRKPDGYFLMHIESDDSVDRPTLNSDSVGDEPVLLHSGDELTVAGIDVEFMLS